MIHRAVSLESLGPLEAPSSLVAEVGMFLVRAFAVWLVLMGCRGRPRHPPGSAARPRRRRLTGSPGGRVLRLAVGPGPHIPVPRMNQGRVRHPALGRGAVL